MDSLLFFKSLADDTRLKILLLIKQEQELCVCELTEALALSQPKISRHIALLRQAGLLQDRRSGKWVYYRLSSDLLPWQVQTLTNCLAEVMQHDEAGQTASTELFQLQQCFLRLTEMGNRPNRQQQCCE